MNMANHSALDGMRQSGRYPRQPLMRLASGAAVSRPSHLTSAAPLASASSPDAVAVPRLWSLVVVALCAYGVTVISVPEPAWADAAPAAMGHSAPRPAKGRTKAKREFVLADMARPHFMVAPLPTDAALGTASPTFTKLNVIMPARAWLTPELPGSAAPAHSHRATSPATLQRETRVAANTAHHAVARIANKVPTTNARRLAAKSAPATPHLPPMQLPPARVRPALAPASATPTILRAMPIAATGTASPTVLITETTTSPVAASPSAALPLPPTGLPAGKMPDWVSANSKIIKVNALKLPPLSQPLAAPLRAASVSADTSYISSVAPSLPMDANGTRLAQNPNLPPAVTPSQPLTSSERLPNQIEVAVSTFVVLLTTNDLQTVAIADPTIADVAVVNARSVLVNGKAPGITSLVVVDHLKIRQYQVRVVPPQAPPGNRTTDVAAAIGIQGINVRQIRDALVLEGEVASSDEVRRAVELASIFSPKVVNELTIRPNDATSPAAINAGQAAEIQNVINIPGVTVREVGDNVILQGTVPSREQYQSAEKLATALAKPKAVINMLQLPTITPEQAAQAIGAVVGGVGGAGGDQTPPAPVINNPNVGTMLAPRPTRRITVRQVGDTIVLEGMADSPADIEQTVATATRTGLQVINRLTVAPPADTAGGLLTSIAMAINQPGVTVTGSAKRIVLQGTVPDTNAAVAAEQIARAFAAQVDNLLTTGHPVLVDVDVSIMELSRNKLRNLGITFDALTGNGFQFGQIPAAAGTNPFDPGIRSGPSGPFALNSLTPLTATLQALITSGNGRLLSNPHTTVLSGRTATFQVGGQIPIPMAQSISSAGQTTSVTFKDFGILIDVVPSASADGVVTMRLRTEVSQLSGTTYVIGNSTIPGFLRRTAVTEVTVQPRGTIALAGLIQHDVRQIVTKVPILASIPILGKLFTSKRFTNDETELVIFVTPRVLPNPLPPGTVGPAAPIAVGNNTNVATTLGNPGIPSFDTNSNFASPGGGGGTGSGGGAGGG